MGWKEISLKDRWIMVAATLQALAAVGTFLVALVGIWKVAPIITYQVQQVARQEEKAKLSTEMVDNHAVTG